MCGIVGMFRRATFEARPGPSLRAQLEPALDSMAARGPDGSGVWVDEAAQVALGHRRLSILDLSERGAQPMSDAGRAVITFNGEIYNFRALRSELQAQGHRFHSESDTEVLLHLYAVHGASMVERLHGMFAFAIWDATRQGILLARDPYGIKPLYYADDGVTFRFASQVKAMRALGVSKEVDLGGLAGFFMLGLVPEPLTILHEVRALPAGSTLWIDRKTPSEPVRYFSVAETFRSAASEMPPRGAARDLLRDALRDSVREHLVSDVPVGAFLSSGIDSSALVALMREVGGDAAEIEGVTIAFDELDGMHEDEAPLAKRIADRYRVRHTVRRVQRAEVEADLPAFYAAMDQPSIDGLNTWLVSKAARERGLKVAISGLGGDELLGGYPSFRDLPRWVAAFGQLGRVPLMGRALRRVIAPVLPALRVSPKAAALIEHGGTFEGAYLLRRGLFMPWELSALMGHEHACEGLARLRVLDHIRDRLVPDPGSDFARVATLEGSLYMRDQLLRDTDWASMAHSLEVRVPLVHVALLRACARSLADHRLGKADLAHAPALPLPDAVVNRRKSGFTTPISHWLRDSPRFSAWRRIPELRHHNVHWARRYAYCVAQSYLEQS